MRFSKYILLTLISVFLLSITQPLEAKPKKKGFFSFFSSGKKKIKKKKSRRKSRPHSKGKSGKKAKRIKLPFAYNTTFISNASNFS